MSVLKTIFTGLRKTSKSRNNALRSPQSTKSRRMNTIPLPSETASKLKKICDAGNLDPVQFAVDYLEGFLDQILDGGFSENVATCYVYDTIEEAVRIARNANEMDGRTQEWAFFQNSKGKFSAENCPSSISSRTNSGDILAGLLDEGGIFVSPAEVGDK